MAIREYSLECKVISSFLSLFLSFSWSDLGGDWNWLTLGMYRFETCFILTLLSPYLFVSLFFYLYSVFYLIFPLLLLSQGNWENENMSTGGGKRITEKENNDAVWGSGNYEIVWDCGKVAINENTKSQHILLFSLFSSFMSWFQVSLLVLHCGFSFWALCSSLFVLFWEIRITGWHVGCGWLGNWRRCFLERPRKIDFKENFGYSGIFSMLRSGKCVFEASGVLTAMK